MGAQCKKRPSAKAAKKTSKKLFMTLHTYMAGTEYCRGQVTDSVVTLERGNKYADVDPNAVRVLDRAGQKCGYVPARDDAPRTAFIMDKYPQVDIKAKSGKSG